MIKKNVWCSFGWAGWGSFHVFFFCLLTWLNETKWHYSTEQSETDMVAFSLKCLFNAPPNRCHCKYRCKAIVRGEFSDCKVHTQPSSEMNKTQVTKWCVQQTTITLSIAPALLLSPLRAEEKRENHSVPETGKQSAAVICHHPLVNQPDPRVEAAERGNGRWSFCHLIFALNTTVLM